MAEKRTDALARQERGEARHELLRRPVRSVGLFEHFADEIDRIFDDFGLGRARTPRWGLTSPGLETELWNPSIEIFQRNSDLVVRADLPGLNKEDVKIDVTDGRSRFRASGAGNRKKNAAESIAPREATAASSA